jgi:hypothetical protein
MSLPQEGSLAGQELGPRKEVENNAGRQVERVEVRGTCIIGGVSTVHSEGQHDQRPPLYGGYNGVSIKNLTKILRNSHN